MAERWFSYDHLRRSAKVLRAAFIAYWLALTFLLLSPKLPHPPIPIDRRARIAHFVCFGLLAATWLLARRARPGPITLRWMALWLAVFAVYGAATELLQTYTGRQADLGDWLANMAGVTAAVLVVRPWKSS